MGIHHRAASEDGAVRNCTARAHLSHWQLCHTPPVSMLTGCPSGDSCPTMGGWGGVMSLLVLSSGCGSPEPFLTPSPLPADHQFP